VCSNFLGNNQYKNGIKQLLTAYKNGLPNVPKAAFTAFTFGFFPANLGQVSDEQVDRFQ